MSKSYKLNNTPLAKIHTSIKKPSTSEYNNFNQ